MEVVLADRVVQCRGGGHLCDLELLIPEPGLAGFDLVMQLRGLVIELQPLLAQLHEAGGGHHRDGEAKEQL